MLFFHQPNNYQLGECHLNFSMLLRDTKRYSIFKLNIDILILPAISLKFFVSFQQAPEDYEAIITKDLDKFDMIMQAYEYEKKAKKGMIFQLIHIFFIFYVKSTFLFCLQFQVHFYNLFLTPLKVFLKHLKFKLGTKDCGIFGTNYF